MIQQNIFPPHDCCPEIAKKFSAGIYEAVKSLSMELIIFFFSPLLLMILHRSLRELRGGGNQGLLVTAQVY